MKLLDTAISFATKQLTKIGISAAKNAPNLLFAGGVTAVVGGTIVAITSASKADAVMDEFNHNMDRMHNAIAEAEATGDPERWYSKEQQGKDIKLIYGHMIMSMAKIYLPVVLLETVGIFMLCKSHSILNKRNAGLAAAYAALQKSYNEYRRRVKERYGEEVENDIYLGRETYTITEKETSENGVTTEVDKTKEKFNPLSPFGIYVSAEDNDWGFKDPHAVLAHLDIIRASLNNMLEHRRSFKRPFITMNEIAEYFGEKQRDEWSTFVIYQNNKDTEGAVKFNVCLDNANIEGSTEWKFVNKLIDGIWVIPNIEGNICDDVKTQCAIASTKELQGAYNGRKILLQ